MAIDEKWKEQPLSIVWSENIEISLELCPKHEITTFKMRCGSC